MAEMWETHAPGLFEVEVEGSVAEERLERFVKAANLSEGLLSNGTNGKRVKLYGLSLMEDGTPVEVLNSDLGFNVVYGENVGREFLQHVVDALQPYPRGARALVSQNFVMRSQSRRFSPSQACSPVSGW